MEDVFAARQLNTRLLTELLCEANIAQVVSLRTIVILSQASWLNAGQTSGLVSDATAFMPALLMYFTAVAYLSQFVQIDGLSDGLFRLSRTATLAGGGSACAC